MSTDRSPRRRRPSTPSAPVGGELAGWAQPPERRARPRRSPKLIAVGVLCACLGGLGTAFAWTNLSTAQTVVVAQRAVARGDMIKPGDFGLADISAAPGVAILPGERLASLVGQEALVDLPVGSLVGPQAVGQLGVPVGDAIVGLKLAPGRSPIGPLPYGARVILLEVIADDEGVAAPWTITATVVTPSQVGSDGSVLVDVSLPQPDALQATTFAAHGDLAIMRLGG